MLGKPGHGNTSSYVRFKPASNQISRGRHMATTGLTVRSTAAIRSERQRLPVTRHQHNFDLPPAAFLTKLSKHAYMQLCTLARSSP